MAIENPTEIKIKQMKELIRKAEEKARTLEGVRKERLKKAIDRMYEVMPENYHPLLIEEGKRKTAMFWNYKNNSNRIYLNNERKGVYPKTILTVLNNQVLEIPSILQAVERFAENGDPLAIKIRNISDTLKAIPHGFDDRAIYQLINRSMSEPDYNDFLSGELPIITHPNGDEFYLK